MKKEDLKILRFPSSISNLERQVEAILFAAEEPLDEESIQQKLKTRTNISKILFSLEKQYKNRGINLICISNKWSFRTAVNLSRVRPEANGIGLTMMVSVLGGMNVSGFKVMGAGKPLVLLYGGESKTLLAIIEASSLGQRRTGAASGLATKYMASEKASTVGIVGTGFQARSQLEAICNVRNIEIIKAFSRNQDRRKEFAAIMSEFLRIDVIDVDAGKLLTSYDAGGEKVSNVCWWQESLYVTVAEQHSIHRLDVGVRGAPIIP